MLTPPTDKLPKFAAIFGLMIIGAGATFEYREDREYQRLTGELLAQQVLLEAASTQLRYASERHGTYGRQALERLNGGEMPSAERIDEIKRELIDLRELSEASHAAYMKAYADWQRVSSAAGFSIENSLTAIYTAMATTIFGLLVSLWGFLSWWRAENLQRKKGVSA
jgi:hypothetical protein